MADESIDVIVDQVVNPMDNNEFGLVLTEEDKRQIKISLENVPADTALTAANIEELGIHAILDGLFSLLATTASTDIAELFAYDGFDPIQMARQLAQLAPTVREFATDMRRVMVFYLERGTKITKAERKMSEKGREMIEGLRKRYNIKETVPQSKTDVTVGRMVAVFADVVGSILHKGIVRPTVVVPGLPVELCFPTAPSVIPEDPEFSYLRLNHLEYTRKLSMLIKSRWPTITNYDEISFSSKRYPEKQRKKLMSMWNIMPKTEFGDDEKVNYAQICGTSGSDSCGDLKALINSHPEHFIYMAKELSVYPRPRAPETQEERLMISRGQLPMPTTTPDGAYEAILANALTLEAVVEPGQDRAKERLNELFRGRGRKRSPSRGRSGRESSPEFDRPSGTGEDLPQAFSFGNRQMDFYGRTGFTKVNDYIPPLFSAFSSPDFLVVVRSLPFTRGDVEMELLKSGFSRLGVAGGTVLVTKRFEDPVPTGISIPVGWHVSLGIGRYTLTDFTSIINVKDIICVGRFLNGDAVDLVSINQTVLQMLCSYAISPYSHEAAIHANMDKGAQALLLHLISSHTAEDNRYDMWVSTDGTVCNFIDLKTADILAGTPKKLGARRSTRQKRPRKK